MDRKCTVRVYLCYERTFNEHGQPWHTFTVVSGTELHVWVGFGRGLGECVGEGFDVGCD